MSAEDTRLPLPDPEWPVGGESAIPPDLQRRYEAWVFTSQIYCLFGGLVASVVWWVLLQWVQELRVALLAEPRHVFAPLHPAYTGVLALLAGVPTAEGVRLVAVRIRFGNWVPMLRAENRTRPMGGTLDTGVGSWLRDVVLVGVGGMLLLNWSTVFSEEDIRIDRLFQVRPEIHRYAEITAIRTNPDAETDPEGTDVRPTWMRIEFRDGSEWTTSSLPWPRPSSAAVRSLELYVRRRSGIAAGGSAPENESPVAGLH